MKIQCMSKDNLNLEIKLWLSKLKKNETLCIKITDCPILKNTYDLQIGLEYKK